MAELTYRGVYFKLFEIVSFLWKEGSYPARILYQFGVFFRYSGPIFRADFI
mgnify:CR=1 FL=1